MPYSVQLPNFMAIYLSKLISEYLSLFAHFFILFFTRKIRAGHWEINSLTKGGKNPNPLKEWVGEWGEAVFSQGLVSHKC